MTAPGVEHGADAGEFAAIARSAPRPVRPEDVSVELIFTDSGASATVGIWRFSAGEWSVILKVLRHGGGGSPLWQSGEEESHWYYWRREALAYSSGLLGAFSGDLRAPQCLGVFDRHDGSVAIWLEDLGHTQPASAWGLDRYRSAARALGQGQGRTHAHAGGSTGPWLAQHFLRRFVERRGSFLSVLDKPAAWDHPLVREHLPADTAAEAAAIWHEREALLSAIESAPLCLCHNDLHPANLFADGRTTVLIDWGFLGAGHAGEDVGNLTFDAILDFFVAPGDFAELHDALTEGYLDGLADSLSIDADVVRRAIWASGAVKYFWIPLAMVDALQQGRTTLNRRPLEEAFATWAKVVPGIFGLAYRVQ
jgi:hypothetical protein